MSLAFAEVAGGFGGAINSAWDYLCFRDTGKGELRERHILHIVTVSKTTFTISILNRHLQRVKRKKNTTFGWFGGPASFFSATTAVESNENTIDGEPLTFSTNEIDFKKGPESMAAPARCRHHVLRFTYEVAAVVGTEKATVDWTSVNLVVEKNFIELRIKLTTLC